MPNSHTEVYVHYVWSTWDRRPLITPEIEERLFNCIRAKCRDLPAHPHAVGGVADHVHILVRLSATLSVAQVAKEIKGASSHFATHVLLSHDFRRQGAYSAFGVSSGALDFVRRDIENQKAHHLGNTADRAWEQCDE